MGVLLLFDMDRVRALVDDTRFRESYLGSGRIHSITDLRDGYTAPPWLHAEMMAEDRRHNEIRRIK